MKNFIPLFLAILFIGAGCVLQPEVPTGEITDPAPVEVVDVYGVIEGYDAGTGVASVRTAMGAVEDVQWPAQAESPEQRLGSVMSARGMRDPSTLVVIAEEASFPESPNLIVASPAPGSTVTSPLLVHGFGRVFEQTFAWRIKDAAGAVVASGSAMTDARETGWYGPFSFEVFLPALSENPFSLEVFEYSAKDGSEQHLVAVPLTLLSTQTTTFSIWFPNVRTGSLLDCSKTFPVERTVAQTSAVGRAAIGELLRGPTDAERAEGYISQIPSATSLNSLVISDHVAKADFSRGLEPGGGSCQVLAIRGQIEGTLLQLETVESVVISVEGDAQSALQP